MLHSSRREQSVQLISAPRDQETSPISRSGAYQPLGLLSIASYLLANQICSKVEILDGEFLSVTEIEFRITADIVGISCTTPSYRNALRIAQAAKNRGAVVVLGGPHPSALGKTILKNRPEVDFIVQGDGEESFAKLLLDFPPGEISNLVYRDCEAIVENPVRFTSLSNLPLLRRDLLPLEPYIDRYSRQSCSVFGRRPAAIFSQKGCMWRHRSAGCLFCGRLDRGWRGRPTDQVWREISNLVDSCGVNFIWDVSDSFISSRDWVLRFAARRPSNLDVSFFLYARSCELDSEIVDALAKIGCKEIFIGIESGDDTLLRKANKGTTSDDNLRAASLLASRGIRMFPCFVLGLPGESLETLDKTIRHAELLSTMCEWSTVSASVLVPLPGSRAFSLLRQTPEGKALLSDADALDLETLGRMWVNRYCTASWASIHEAINSILNLCPNVSSFFNFQHNFKSLPTSRALNLKERARHMELNR